MQNLKHIIITHIYAVRNFRCACLIKAIYGAQSAEMNC